MGRILLLLIIAFLIWALFKGFFKSQLKKPEPPSTSVAGEDMVACAQCGVNLPRSEAQERDGKLVCRENPNCKALP